MILLEVPAAYSLAIRPVKKEPDALFFFASTKLLSIVGEALLTSWVAHRLCDQLQFQARSHRQGEDL